MSIQTCQWEHLVRADRNVRISGPKVSLSAADKAIVDNKSKVTEDQLRTFLDVCWTKYVKAKIEPGE